MSHRRNAVSAVCIGLLLVAPLAQAEPAADGVVRVKSAYSVPETIARIKQDIAAKGILFFSEVDQAKLAASAGIALPPSTLLTFGNPPLSIQFLTANPNAGSTGRCGCWFSRTRRATCGRCTPTSRGSRSGTASRIAPSSSAWPAA